MVNSEVCHGMNLSDFARANDKNSTTIVWVPLGDGVNNYSRRSLKSKEAVRQIFTLKIILVYVKCSLTSIWNGHKLWTVGAQCAQFDVSIHYDFSRHVKVCLTDRLASLKVLVEFFLCFGKGTRTGPYMFCDMFRFKIDVFRCMHENHVCKLMSVLICVVVVKQYI